MKLVVVSGPPSVGKTSVLLHALGQLRARGMKLAVVKLDCLVADDEAAYAAQGIRAITGLSRYLCPDHFLATNMDRIIEWGLEQEELSLLVLESAGLCNRCSPYVDGQLAVAVMDMNSGIGTPRKVGPLLRSADLVVLTRGDLISQAEREVYRTRVSMVNRRGRILEVNGLTGQGSLILADQLEQARSLTQDPEGWRAPERNEDPHQKYDPLREPEDPLRLRYPMPAAVCSFCLGERRLGEFYARGNVRFMEIEGLDRASKKGGHR